MPTHRGLSPGRGRDGVPPSTASAFAPLGPRLAPRAGGDSGDAPPGNFWSHAPPAARYAPLLLGLILPLLLARPVHAAQSHPCDHPGPSGQTIEANAPHRLQFCQPQAEQIEAIVVRLDEQTIDLLPITAKTAPSATGLVLYETALFLQVSAGSHVLYVAAYNKSLTGAFQVGAASAPLAFSAVNHLPRPSGPAITGVVR